MTIVCERWTARAAFGLDAMAAGAMLGEAGLAGCCLGLSRWRRLPKQRRTHRDTNNCLAENVRQLAHFIQSLQQQSKPASISILSAAHTAIEWLNGSNCVRTVHSFSPCTPELRRTYEMPAHSFVRNWNHPRPGSDHYFHYRYSYRSARRRVSRSIGAPCQSKHRRDSRR